ncbi:MAG: hypothetical protein LBE31_02355 [Deltaproteobacteria bacterium]|nr:hypothetical protein [Deltaproteobacteria bacterium]
MVFEMESVDRVGSLVLEAMDLVVRELNRTNDSDGEKLLPSVLLTLAVMGLCRQEPIGKVIELLSAMCLKVERGDFRTSDDDDDGGEFTPPPRDFNA